jgi:hypothetical protein
MSNGMRDFNGNERVGKERNSYGDNFAGRKDSFEIRKKM